jgi:hypothetical protein
LTICLPETQPLAKTTRRGAFGRWSLEHVELEHVCISLLPLGEGE